MTGEYPLSVENISPIPEYEEPDNNLIRHLWTGNMTLYPWGKKVLKRNGYDISVELFRKIREQEVSACITASSVTDLFYIIRKETHDTERIPNRLCDVCIGTEKLNHGIVSFGSERKATHK